MRRLTDLHAALPSPTPLRPTSRAHAGVALALLVAFPGHAVAASLAGSVLGEDGSPVAGATVVAYDARLGYATARTGTAGTWRIDGIPAGDYRLRALPQDDDPRADGFHATGGDGVATWDYCSGDVVAAEDGAPRTGLDIVLRAGATLTGRLVDLDGVPVAGATVAAVGDSERTELVSRQATTDADGRFALVGLDLDPGGTEPYLLAVAAAGFPKQYLGPAYRSTDAEQVRITRDGPNDVGDWALLDGIRLSGIVLGPDGPVQEGVVYAYATSQVVDADVVRGEWAVDGLPPGDVLYWAEADGLATTYYPESDRPTATRLPVPDEGAERRDADLILRRESVLDVTLAGDGVLDEVSVLLYNSDGTVGRGAPVAADGRVRIDGLWPGEYRLIANGDDGGFVTDWLREADGSERWITVAEGANTLTATLPVEAGWRGAVRDETGAPVYGAVVTAFHLDSDDVRGAGSDSEGAFDLGGLPGGTWTLRAAHTPYCDNDPGYTTMWWGGADHAPDGVRLEADAEPWTLDAGQTNEATDITLARDDDHDGMGDAWERAAGLDPARDDAGEDPDGDGVPNVDEWLLGTDPVTADAPGEGCGCATRGPAPQGAGAIGSVIALAAAHAARRRRRTP